MLRNRNLPLLLSQVRETIISHFRPILNFFGLTEQQWRILRVLAEKEEMEPREMCETCQILSPSMTGIIKRLEELHLIKRKNVPEDKRRILISMTAKGKKLMTDMGPLIQQQYDLLEEAYGGEMITTLYNAIDDFMLIKDKEVKHIDLPPQES